MTGWLTMVAALAPHSCPAPPPPAQARLVFAGQEQPPVRVKVVTVAPYARAREHKKVAEDPFVAYPEQRDRYEGCLPVRDMITPLGPRRWGVWPGTEGCPLIRDSGLAAHPRIVPSFVNGVAEGFKVFPGPDTLLGSAGFRPGDVILKVNGRSITSPDAALEVYQSLTLPVQVELRRRGEIITHTYERLD
ncbi:MAG: PDZ domain-containing protein [Deltaproteobacteria bacterium]|nr:PDZ domain-containing protein [Deltaproteobacteria bacterium]